MEQFTSILEANSNGLFEGTRVIFKYNEECCCIEGFEKYNGKVAIIDTILQEEDGLGIGIFFEDEKDEDFTTRWWVCCEEIESIVDNSGNDEEYFIPGIKYKFVKQFAKVIHGFDIFNEEYDILDGMKLHTKEKSKEIVININNEELTIDRVYCRRA